MEKTETEELAAFHRDKFEAGQDEYIRLMNRGQYSDADQVFAEACVHGQRASELESQVAATAAGPSTEQTRLEFESVKSAKTK